MKKYLNLLLGLVVGVVTLPLSLIIWPALCAWFLYNETEDDL